VNVTLLVGIAAIVLTSGVLVGHALNIRARIGRDRRQARARLELDDLERQVDARRRLTRSPVDPSRPAGRFLSSTSGDSG